VDQIVTRPGDQCTMHSSGGGTFPTGRYMTFKTVSSCGGSCHSAPYLITQGFLGPRDSAFLNRLTIGSAVFAKFTRVSVTQTYGPRSVRINIDSNKYAGPPYSRAKIYAAHMSRGSSGYRSISAAAGPRPTSAANPPAAADAVDRWDKQTDGQRTLDRADRVIDCIRRSLQLGGSVAEWLACWTQAQNGPAARVHIAAATLSGNSLRQTVHSHRASVLQAAKLVAALLRVARVTAGLAESNGSLPPGL